jgi:hypothetical protein
MNCPRRTLPHLTSALLFLLLSVPVSAHGQDAPPAPSDGGSPFGLGFQSSWPAYGLSGLYDMNERITLQAVLGALGTVSTLSGRLLYHFGRQPKYSPYAFGTVGLWRYSYRGLGSRSSESTVAFGGGAGVELDWRGILTAEGETPTFPSLYSTIDLGLTLAGFEHYAWSAFTYGVGLHYRF